MILALLLVLAVTVPQPGEGAGRDERSLVQVQLDSPFKCENGETLRVSEKTPRELFGDEWAKPWVHVKFDEPTNLVRVSDPVLKPNSRMRRTSGSATVTALIDADGKLVEAHVVCSTDPAFHEIFLQAMDSARFTAPMVEGVPMPTLMRQGFTY